MAKIVLVADDNRLIRKALCELFEKEEHYDICAEACNGAEAIELARTHNPDLIILDLSMPVLGGRGYLRKCEWFRSCVIYHAKRNRFYH